MTRYAAFLRAINAGKGRNVKMDALRALVEGVPGLERVQSYIASDNLIFDAPAAADPAELEQALELRFLGGLGKVVETFIRAEQELREAAELRPFGSLDQMPGALMMVGLLRDALPDATVEKLLSAQNESNRLHVGGRHFYWLRLPIGGGSSYAETVFYDKVLGTEVTIRSMRTLRAVLDKYF